MKLKSYTVPLGTVLLPYAGRQKYMITFDLADIRMPEGYEDYLKPVKLLCKRAGAMKGIAHLTVDEKVVKKGMSQRRPHPHVDGCFEPARGVWSHEGGGWNHTCNNVPLEFIHRMPVIVASSVMGCRVWEGIFDGIPMNNGDLSHLKLPEGRVLPANEGFLFSPDCVHESMVQERDVERTFIRIALPVGMMG